MIVKIRSSLRAKLFLFGLGIITFFVVFNVISTFFFLIPFSAKVSVNKMKSLAKEIAEQDILLDDEFESFIEVIANDYNVKVTIIDEEENTLFSTKYSKKKGKGLGPNTTTFFRENKEKLDDGEIISISKMNNNDLAEPIRCIVINKMNDNNYVILTRTLQSLRNTEKVVLIFDIIVAIVTLGIGSILIFRLGNVIIRPINEMTTIAEHISNLQFDKRVESHSKDEIGRLGNAINQMSNHLENDIERMQKDIEYRKILVRNLSHEIKSPVAVIMGYADRMNKLIESNPEKAIEYSKIISNESTRIDVLVREMLNFSRMDQELNDIDYEKLKLSHILDEVMTQLIEESIEKKVDFDLMCFEDIDLYANRELLKRAIYNLGNNALKYGTGEPVIIRILAEMENNICTIQVYNSGSFIPEEELPYIWNAFYKVDKARNRNTKGYGIGLSIVYEIIEAHKGKCDIRNEKDGVTFILQIPQKQ